MEGKRSNSRVVVASGVDLERLRSHIVREAKSKTISVEFPTPENGGRFYITAPWSKSEKDLAHELSSVLELWIATVQSIAESELGKALPKLTGSVRAVLDTNSPQFPPFAEQSSMQGASDTPSPKSESDFIALQEKCIDLGNNLLATQVSEMMTALDRNILGACLRKALPLLSDAERAIAQQALDGSELSEPARTWENFIILKDGVPTWIYDNRHDAVNYHARLSIGAPTQYEVLPVLVVERTLP